jgi:predicted GIY-YIG superfamily endonuclease
VTESAGIYVVYVLRRADGSLYVGHTSELSVRLQQHEDGIGSQFTSLPRPVTLVYSESHESKATACAREKQIKRWTRQKKEALIAAKANALPPPKPQTDLLAVRCNRAHTNLRSTYA